MNFIAKIERHFSLKEKSKRKKWKVWQENERI